MEPRKCKKCGSKFEESKTNKTCQKYIEKDFIELSISKSIENQNVHINTEESDTILNIEECLNNSASFKTDANTYGKIQIASSQNIIIGNVTYIKDPIHITQIAEQNNINQLFLNDSELKTSNLNIISRNKWMAQPAKLKTPLPETAQYVIIAHTASEAGYTQPQNALLVKLVQTFHMESRNWDDIAYNFLVGCDGNIYEGRGWNIQGAHTYGYNRKSICIAFIGCFMDHLPPVSAINAARKLIFEGVKLGYIPENYTLVGHCQCTPIESPGVQLFNEIKKWPKWKELTSEDAKLV